MKGPAARRAAGARDGESAIIDPGVFFTTSILAAGLIASAVVHGLGEVRRYREAPAGSDPFLSGRRLVRRLIAAAVVCALMIAVFAGVNYGSSFLYEKTTFVRYWTATASGIGVLLLLAFLDLRETRRVASREMRLELERALRLVDGQTDEPDPSGPDGS